MEFQNLPKLGSSTNCPELLRGWRKRPPGWRHSDHSCGAKRRWALCLASVRFLSPWLLPSYRGPQPSICTDSFLVQSWASSLVLHTNWTSNRTKESNSSVQRGRDLTQTHKNRDEIGHWGKGPASSPHQGYNQASESRKSKFHHLVPSVTLTEPKLTSSLDLIRDQAK